MLCSQKVKTVKTVKTSPVNVMVSDSPCPSSDSLCFTEAWIEPGGPPPAKRSQGVTVKKSNAVKHQLREGKLATLAGAGAAASAPLQSGDDVIWAPPRSGEYAAATM